MYFEEALKLMRKGYWISRGISGENFRLNDGHFEIVNEEYPDGCHTNVPGDDLSSDRWELTDRDILYQEITDCCKYMSPRIVNCLRNECGIKNKHVLTGDVVRYSEKELLRLPNFYLKSLKELKWHLNEIGLFLGMELSKSQLEKLEQFRKAYENEF